MIRRPIPVLFLGAALRELLPLLRRLADALDPAGNVGQAWGPREVPPEPVCPDVVPDALLVRW